MGIYIFSFIKYPSSQLNTLENRQFSMFFLFCRLLLGYICNNFRKIPLARFPPGYFPTIFLYIPFSRRFPCTQPRIWVYAKIFFKNTHVILLLEAQPTLCLNSPRGHMSLRFAVSTLSSHFVLANRGQLSHGPRIRYIL